MKTPDNLRPILDAVDTAAGDLVLVSEQLTDTAATPDLHPILRANLKVAVASIAAASATLECLQDLIEGAAS